MMRKSTGTIFCGSAAAHRTRNTLNSHIVITRTFTRFFVTISSYRKGFKMERNLPTLKVIMLENEYRN